MAVRDPQEEKRGRNIPEFDLAIERKNASFTQLVMALHGMRKCFNPNEENRALCEEYYSEILEAFEKGNSPIKCMFYCSESYGYAVAQTDDNQLHITTGSASAPILEIKYITEKIAVEAHRLLDEKELEFCIDSLYSLTTDFFDRLDGIKPEDQTRKNLSEIIHFMTNELKDVKDYFIRSAQRRVRIEYFKGMLLGLVIVSIEAILIYFGLFRMSIVIGTLPAIVGSLIMGGIGALVSVMSDMSKGEMQLDFEAGKKQIFYFGAFRPVVGSILGVVVFILMLSSLLPVTVPEDMSTLLYFSLIIGFIAGFTERWARDMLGLAKSRISPDTGNNQQEGSSQDKETPRVESDL